MRAPAAPDGADHRHRSSAHRPYRPVSATSIAAPSAAILLRHSRCSSCGHRVGHDAGAGLQQREPVAHDDRAQRDAGVDRAVVADVADRARVDAAPPALDLRDELHRAHLRRPGDGAGGERRLEQREARPRRLAQPALDLRDEVHDVRVALDLELLRRPRRCRGRRRGRGRCARGRRASGARRAPSRRAAARSASASSSAPSAPRWREPAIGFSVATPVARQRRRASRARPRRSAASRSRRTPCTATG